VAHRGGHDIPDQAIGAGPSSHVLEAHRVRRFVLALMSDAAPREHDVRVAGTVLIVDDHADFRAAARALLEADGYEVIGEAADGDAGSRLAEELSPTLVLLDIGLPGPDGFAIAERLAAMANPPAVVLISSRERSSYGRRIDGAPVRGFLSKRELSGAALASMLA
jgi:DNA-binding NarL/FixJ family response regulator